MKAGSFAVIIATCDRRDTLLRTLDSLKKCRIPDSFSRLIIIENGGRECPEVVQTLPGFLRALYLHLPVANKSAALNLAMEYLQEDFVLFFDDDIRIDPLVLQAYASAFRRHGQGFFYGGKCTAEFDSAPEERVLRFFPESVRGLDYGDSEQIREVIRFLGCNWAAPTAALRAVGGFNPHFGPGATRPTGQETLMQRQLVRRGLCGVYLPQCPVSHRVPASHCTMTWLRQRYYRQGIENGWRDKRPTFDFVMNSLARLAKAVLSVFRSLFTGDTFARVQRLGLVWNTVRGHREGRRYRALMGDCE